MSKKVFPKSQLPIRKSLDFLPKVFQTDSNDKFLSGVFDPLIQPGTLEKTVGYIGKRYGKTYSGKDVYLDDDATLRSRYQLEPGIVIRKDDRTENFYDYIDFKNILNFFGNKNERDDLVTSQEHYSWNPPIDWDKFVNYREYFWVPGGPPSIPVYGQQVGVVSTYRVKLSVESSFIFSPDGYTNNPTLTLYRGQTYKFVVNVPKNGLVFRRSYDTGSLILDPLKSYEQGSLVVFNDAMWRATRVTTPTDYIDENSSEWEYVDISTSSTVLDYNNGVTNNGAETGTITFTVPYDAPDVLFYQSKVDPNRFGRLIISDIEASSKIDIEKDLLGKTTYTSSNGIELSNGMLVTFEGVVTPEKYSTGKWLVEGVGTGITLTLFDSLVVPVLSTETPEILFDNEGFDTNPFDDASAYPGSKDYVTIAKSSVDANPWSRYNRWFHRSVLELSHRLSGSDFSSDESARAKRPIIEFLPNLQLYKHGSVAKETVDYIDTYTTDVFSSIEGSTGYSVDGETLFDGARVLVTADTDSLANNRIYVVSFITHNGSKQITLKQVSDTESNAGETVLVRRGKVNQGLMFYFDGTQWNKSQEKTTVNQAPLFDVFDETGVSFSNEDYYPVTSFAGTPLIGYKVSNGVKDSELGFSLTYLNIDNIGDIVFESLWDSGTFTYESNQVLTTANLSTGYLKFSNTDTFTNTWELTDNTYIQPIIDSVIIGESTNVITLTTVNWNEFDADPTSEIHFYVNGVKTDLAYTRSTNTFTFAQPFAAKDVLSLKVIFNGTPNTGYYEFPVSLEKNPLNEKLTSFTFGQAVDHVKTGLEFSKEFVGSLPGNSNLRDLSGYQSHAKRFMKHDGVAPLAVSVLVDKKVNLIKSIRYAKKAYTEFKNNFLKLAESLDFNDDVPVFVDNIMAELTKTKVSSSPFVDSDMIGSGAFTKLVHTVDDDGIKTYALSQPFDLKGLSRKAVYLYVNGNQLIYGKDYVFDPTFAFVNILANLVEGDVLEIREYNSTAFNHIPPTPTKMGIYKKYLPEIFVDDTYVKPKEMIRGHDGSLTTTFGDYRDDALLELELRIYNNIKQEYNEEIFDIDSTIAGYYREGRFSKNDIDQIISYEFLQWIANTNIDYVNNNYFDSENSFTYTYSNMADPTKTVSLPGWWRGVYNWFYDTDRPHTHPWEMLGFSEKPTWWEGIYGAAPYTNGNLILWEDLENGIIRQGDRAGIHDRYKRPGLTGHIPVDVAGNLVSPLDSNLAQNFSLINNKGSFKFGDEAPAEHTWRITSEYPFAIVIAMCLLRPFEFIGRSFDRSRISKNILGQTVHTGSKTFVEINDFIIPTIGGIQTTGLASYIIDYLLSQNVSTTLLEDRITSIDVALSYRMSGFVDQNQQRFVLDSKSPKSASSSIFIPPENQEIFFNVSAPIQSIVYSAVILEKLAVGWKVTGYDNQEPFFNYYEAIATQGDPLINVGGVSEGFLVWSENKFYSNGVVVQFQNEYYRSLKSHTSGSSFDITLWKKLPGLPKKNSIEAFSRQNFNSFKVSKLSYGTIIPTIQGVVDFLLGYEKYLVSAGFVFETYDPENQVVQDWSTSCKEFMYWTQHNWAEGSLITLSPAAEKLEVTYPVGVPDNILDSFYDYQVYRSDGNPLTPNFINIKRDFQNLTVESVNTTDGIYFFKAYLVLKEHVAIFDDRTVFNDVLYDRTTGYRQERIKSRGFRTVDWDGDYTSPGFLFDNVNIQTWQPFVDYRLGDIVSYKTYNWVSLVNQQSGEMFDPAQWSRLDTTPTKSLIPNFDYRINQFEDYYNLDADGLQSSQRDLGRHAIGYQQRDYLQNLAEDEVTQFQLYQGYIRDKGTMNAAVKIFDKLSKTEEDSIVLNEEWAFDVGTFGGQDQLRDIEFAITKDQLEINPQPIIFVSANPADTGSDQYLRVPPSQFIKATTPFTTDLIPKADSEMSQTAGYVRLDQVDFVVKNRDEILGINIYDVRENDHIWITFDNISWDVLRFNRKPLLTVVGIDDPSSGKLELTFNRRHGFSVGDIIGITDVVEFNGFFKVQSVSNLSLVILTDAAIPETLPQVGVYGFTECRFDTVYGTNESEIAGLSNGSKIWIDQDQNNKWTVLQKNSVFVDKKITDYGTSVPQDMGYSVVYGEILKQVIASMPARSQIMIYNEGSTELQAKQSIFPDTNLYPKLNGSFGQTMAISPDNIWLVVGSPLASGIPSSYIGEFKADVSYRAGDIVSSNEVLYEALINDPAGLDSADWRVVNSVPYNPDSGRGNGAYNQGLISVYKWVNQTWTWRGSLVSPKQTAGEKFGTKVSLAQSGNTYWMSVSAPGSDNNNGRVYVFTNTGTTWDLTDNVLAGENQGDAFGNSLSMNKDGSVIVVGSPEFNFPEWNATTLYKDGDVVKYLGSFYRLFDSRDHAEDHDSSAVFTSINDIPTDGEPWQDIGDTQVVNTGKTYVFQRNANNQYQLAQTINAESLSSINDSGIASTVISAGDRFGYDVDVDATGSHIVISSPLADVDLQNQGAVYYFATASLTSPQWRLKQKLESFEQYNNLLFGSSIKIGASANRIVVGAKNAPYKLSATFSDGTTFDRGTTVFAKFSGFSGQVYSFERVSGKYLLTEKLEADVTENESFGHSLDTSSNVIVVGSPNYRSSTGSEIGIIRLFKKDPTAQSLTTIASQQTVVDLSKIKNIMLIDTDKNVKVQDVDFIDPAKLKILGLAEEEIKFKTPYDPAIYSVGTEEQVVDSGSAWYDKHVGKLWWNTSTVKWIDYEQGDLSYRVGNWGQMATGSSVDVYEWVSTPLLPSEWSSLADTADGLANGISGQPLHPNDDVYTVKESYNPITQQLTSITYYYWVKSSTILPKNVPGRRIPAANVASIISNPVGLGIPIVAVVDSDKLLAYNFSSALSSNNASLNLEFYKNETTVNPVHKEYLLLSEGVADSVPNDLLETKWIDSLIGFDKVGNTVPDIYLTEREKYGLSFRPRQSMFVNRKAALKIALDKVNTILESKPFTDLLNFENLNAVDPLPAPGLNEYDIEVDTVEELNQLGSIRVRQAILQANIINGEIDSVDIVDAGFGYKKVPFVEVEGLGKGAKVTVTLDNQGRVKTATVVTRGKKYDTATINIRPYAVLVRHDKTLNNFWGIYSWDQYRKVFYRSKSQGYDTTRYWTTIDWWKSGYGETSRVVTEISNLYLEPTISTEVGDLIKVKEYANGGWAVLERVNNGTGEILKNYTVVGREQGTIKILDTLYSETTSGIGFDNTRSYDATQYDSDPATELRNIFKAIKENILVDDLAVEWNKLFFSTIRYAFSEQDVIPWAFKTSFVAAKHNVGSLEQKVNYKNDNLPAFQSYLEEVKPYRTTIREYTSRYTGIDPTNSDVTDFDLPPAYSLKDGKIVPVDESYNLLDQYPWKNWADNIGFSVTSIKVSNPGADYTTPPTVLIEGNGTGATAKAFIANGKVSGIRVENSGSGYTKAPTVSLVGGNGSSLNKATAVAILGDTKARMFTLSMKFDRISKDGLYNSFTHTETINIVLNNSSVFKLEYAPTTDKSKVLIYKNGQVVLNNEYSVVLYTEVVDSYTVLKGKLIFNQSLDAGDVLVVEYEKNDKLFDAVNRIQKYYAPTSGMVGNDVGQLMTGIDFGGVRVQGTTFDVTGGWDALPWFTDSWDSVEPNTDYHIVVTGPVETIDLPYVPDQNQLISVYIKRSGDTVEQRLDDVSLISDGSTIPGLDGYSTNPEAVMPSFVGDGSTVTVDIGRYITTATGDTLVFRKFDSDGSLVINDPNIVDTKVSGGTLEAMSGAYATATGLLAEEIKVDGGQFISADHAAAPEENIPGQVLDSLSIKVFQTSSTGAAPLQSFVIPGDGVRSRYNIGLTVLEKSSVIVYIDKVRKTIDVDFRIDFVTNEVVFFAPPADGSLVEVIAIGRGGVSLMDYQEFVTDGNTKLFLTKANYSETSAVFVTVNGSTVDLGFVNSTVISEETGADIESNKTMVMFAENIPENSVVKIVVVGAGADADLGNLSLIRVNRQQFEFEGSTRTFILDKFVELPRNSADSAMIVTLTRYPLEPELGVPSTRKLKGPDTYYEVYDGTNNEVSVGTDPDASVTSVDVKVYINNELQPFVISYVYDGTTGKVIVNPEYLELNDVIKIEVSSGADYVIDGDSITIKSDVLLESLNETDNDIIEVTWFSEYPTFDIVSDQYTGGKVNYKLARRPLDSHYVWVYLNGRRLVNQLEYAVSVPRNVVYLNVETTTSDIVEIFQYGNSVYKDPRGFEICKDMLNIDSYKRYSITNVELAKDLYYYDQTIEVTDGSMLDVPNPARNIPGVVMIQKERIEYLSKNGNVLSHLRRGAGGTSIGTVYAAGSKVVNSGINDTIPYADTQEREDFISDGSSVLIGPLPFVPVKTSRNTALSGSEYSECDQIEVFVGGRRLRKDQVSFYEEILGTQGSGVSEVLPPEFTVDGVNPYVKLAAPVDAGVRILIIRKIGKTWYERSEVNASKGITLTDNQTPIARFIDEKPSQLP